MKPVYLLLVVSVVGAAGYFWYTPVLPMCRLPVSYTIGDFDERFGISKEEAMAALKEAEGIWEEALGRDDIFVYDESGTHKVNFIYDERQREAEKAASELDDLSMRGDANEVLVELHSRLVEEYESYEVQYQSMRSSYDAKLAAYNEEVERYNQNGGAPADAYEDLERRRVALDREKDEINQLAAKMNDLVDQINSIGEKGNELISDYNDRVNSFNNNYGHGHEYTQGDYQSREINIYTFGSDKELALVLAHELGHSLSIDHVENPTSIMYYLMGEQSDPPTLSEEDKKAFEEVCSGSFLSRLLSSFGRLYNI